MSIERLEVPLTEVNGHPSNDVVRWQALLPPVAEPWRILLSVDGVQEVAEAGGLDRVLVLPSEMVKLMALAHSGFDSGMGAPGELIADQAAFVPERAFTLDEIGLGSPREAVVKLEAGEIFATLRAWESEARPDQWMIYLNDQLGKGLGRLALRAAKTQPGRIFKVMSALWRHRQLFSTAASS